MAKKIYGPVNGARKEVTAIYGPVNGARKEVYKVYGSVNGARKLVWEKQAANLYGILTYYGTTIVPAGTIVDEADTTPALSATLLQPLSDFENAIQTQWVNEGHQEQIDFTYPIKIEPYISGSTMASGEQLSPGDDVWIEVMTTDGYYSSMWDWSYYSDVSSYVDIRAAESAFYDDYSCTLTVFTQPGEVIDKTTQTSFTLTSLSMYETGYNQSSGFNIGSETIPTGRIKAFEFGDSITSVPNNFLANSALVTIDLGNSNITTIGDSFLYNCHHFNPTGTLDLSSVTSIGTYFLGGCTSFNSPIVLGEGLTTIQSSFMGGCNSFNQPLTLPSSVTRIDDSFMHSCKSFNQPFTVPSGITTIGTYFLASCHSLNSPITLNCPNLTSVGNFFMTSLRDFTSYVSVTTSAAAPTDNYSFNATLNNVPAYTTGVQICGDWEGQISSRSSYPYRKIVPCSL